MAQFVETCVLGAGVVGLATARALALAGSEVLVIDAADRFGSVTSARNSEVIHAGIYYPQGSVKAKTCVEGKHMLYAYCAKRGIPYRQCGKLIVATSEAQVETLESIRSKAYANGVRDLKLQTKAEANALEPEVECHAALLSPSTGIVDSHSYMLSLLGELEDAGGMLALSAPFLRAKVLREGVFEVHLGGDSPMQLSCKNLINSGGLAAPRLAKQIEGLSQEALPQEYYAKGNYYSLSCKSPFQRLVYPVPEEAGLGVHATVDLQGRARFGPDVEWVSDDSDYDVDPLRAMAFYSEVRKYWPQLPDGALVPDYSGIRPKICPPGMPSADFQVQGAAMHGVRGLVNLFGIESPGLTASLALAQLVLNTLEDE